MVLIKLQRTGMLDRLKHHQPEGTFQLQCMAQEVVITSDQIELGRGRGEGHRGIGN